MKGPTTVEVLFTTAFTFPFLISLCIFYREKSWQSHKPRALAWWSISAAVSATLSQLIFWTFVLSGIFGRQLFDSDVAGYAVAGGAILSLFALLAGLRGAGWHRVTNTGAAFAMAFGWLITFLPFAAGW
jgi:hypothetical protein